MDHLHRALGRAHAEIYWRMHAFRDDRGQGTVEYAAIMLLVAAVMGFAVSAINGDASIAEKITKKLGAAIDGVTAKDTAKR